MMRVVAIASCLAFAGPPLAEEADAFAEAIAVREGEIERAQACAAQLQALAREYGEGHPRTPEALGYAARCHEIAGEFGAAVRTRELLVDRYPQSAVARLALIALAEQYRTIAQFERAATMMETYARRHPNDGKQTAEFIHEAALLRAGLGQEAAALTLLERAETQLERRDPAWAAGLFWGRVDLLPGTYPNDQARRAHAEEYLRRHGAQGGMGLRILAEATIAGVDWRRSCKQKDTPLDLCVSFKPAVTPAPKGKPARRTCAGPEARIAVVHPRDPKLAEAAQTRFQAVLRLGQAWQREGEGDDPKLRARVLEALDLAAIAVADRDLPAYLELRVPSGLSFTIEDWRKHSGDPRSEKLYKEQLRKAEESKRRMVDFHRAKTELGQKLLQRYERVVVGKQSPRGMFAAAARAALVQATFADELLAADVPRELKSDPMIDAYCGAMRNTAAGVAEVAKQAFAYCLSRAEAYHYNDAAVAFCEGELERRHPREFPALHELFARGQALPSEPEVVPVQLEPPEDDAVSGDM